MDKKYFIFLSTLVSSLALAAPTVAITITPDPAGGFQVGLDRYDVGEKFAIGFNGKVELEKDKGDRHDDDHHSDRDNDDDDRHSGGGKKTSTQHSGKNRDDDRHSGKDKDDDDRYSDREDNDKQRKVIPGLESVAKFEVLDFRNKSIDFQITLFNTSFDGITSRTTALAFDLSEELDSVTVNQLMSDFRLAADQTLPGISGDFDVCLTSSPGRRPNCGGGGGGGVSTGESQTFRVSFRFDDPIGPDGITLNNFADRYQSINGTTEIDGKVVNLYDESGVGYDCTAYRIGDHAFPPRLRCDTPPTLIPREEKHSHRHKNMFDIFMGYVNAWLGDSALEDYDDYSY